MLILPFFFSYLIQKKGYFILNQKSFFLMQLKMSKLFYQMIFGDHKLRLSLGTSITFSTPDFGGLLLWSMW
mgnify:CR=1 FL=1